MKTRLGPSILSSWNGTSASSSMTTLTTSGRMARRTALMFTSFEAAAAVRTGLPALDDEGGVREAEDDAGDGATAAGSFGSLDTAEGRGSVDMVDGGVGGGASTGAPLATVVEAPVLAGCAFSQATSSGANFTRRLDGYPVWRSCSSRKAVVRSRAS